MSEEWLGHKTKPKNIFIINGFCYVSTELLRIERTPKLNALYKGQTTLKSNIFKAKRAGLIQRGEKEQVLPCEGAEALAQGAQRSCGCPIPGSVQGQVGYQSPCTLDT